MSHLPTPVLAPLLLAQASTGVLESFAQAGPMAKVILAVLGIFSVVSWAVMIWKWLHLKRASRQSRQFLEIFRGSKRFSEVSAALGRVPVSPLVGVFQAGYAEIDHQIRSFGAEPGAAAAKYRIRSLEGVERTLRRAIATEALVNTAAGLAAAIPALIAYNYFANELRTQRTRMEDFALEFLNLAERNFTGWPS